LGANIEMTNFEIVQVPSVIPILLEACPGIEPIWAEHQTRPSIGEYIDIAVVAQYLADSYSSNNTHFMPTFFATVEDILVNGHPKQKEMIVIGLLETLQNVTSHRHSGYQVFERWLGPATLTQWKALEVLWQGKSSLMDVVRDEKKGR
jgi:hypothetical protein